jgi:hypothetical protein
MSPLIVRARTVPIALACAVLIALGLWSGESGSIDRPPSRRPGAPSIVDASSLYNSGTTALHQGEIGPAVAFLIAAARLEPRASDIRLNLSRALAAASALRGDDESSSANAPAVLLSSGESWWLAAALVALGSILGTWAALLSPSRRKRLLRVSGLGALLSGLTLSIFLHARALEEHAHPEAVVVAATLSIERAPDEPSRAAVILSAGERIRLGRSRGSLVEVRLGGTSVGWAERSGLWRVIDTPLYTSHHESP